MGLFDTAEARLVDLETRVAALEGAAPVDPPPVDPPADPDVWVSGVGSAAFEAAIDACPSPGVVGIPAGSYTVTTQIDLRSGVILQGVGEQTVITMPAKSEFYNLFRGVGVTGAGLRDLTIQSPADGQVLAIHLSNHVGCLIERVTVNGCEYALKADTAGSALTVRDFKVRGCGQPIYCSYLDGGTFQRLDLDAVTQKLRTYTYHAVYLCDGNTDFVFEDVVAQGGSGFVVQLWSESEWDEPSTAISFNGLTIPSGLPLVIGEGFDGVTVRGYQGTADEWTPIWLYSPRNVMVEGFDCSGGDALIGTYASADAVNVTLRDGVYHGPVLVQPGAQITNLSLENVVLVP